MAEAHIDLSYSRDAGVVAISSGPQHPWAATALREAGFRSRQDGTYHVPGRDPDVSRSALANLVECAARHRTSVSTNSRRYIGDAARDIAERLPGRWRAEVEVYSHPVWQEDLVHWLWDNGDLGRIAQTERIAYAASLTDMAEGTTLLLVEHPGKEFGYLVGALASRPFNGGHDDPHAPSSVAVGPFPGRSAKAIADHYLPGYHRALHARRTDAVATALTHIRDEYGAWNSMAESERNSDATSLPAPLSDTEFTEFQDRAWRIFQDVIDHVDPLARSCRPASSPWPQDTVPLGRITYALAQLSGFRLELGDGQDLAREERIARTWPAIETWLTHTDAFLRQVHHSAPQLRLALPVTATPRALPVARPASRR
ncbi:hypothetical protein ACIO3O_08375 [Streptomyces sp. NPDC087440]|uniref:hypothetical protein n=1 Tax=Streptomyces sp. NPDC087440 TaxID=3365790 RepID=UPI003814ABEF